MNRKKILICGFIILSLCAASGCRGKNGISPKSEKLKTSSSIFSSEKLKNAAEGGRIVLADDRPCQGLWVPQNQEATLSKIISWLQKAETYKGKIPESKKVIFNAYLGPSILQMFTSDNHKISICPEFYFDKNSKIHYIDDVLQVNNDGQKIYIKSRDLYDWLKNDKWKTEFKSYH